MSDFLPKDYKRPSTSGNYMKLEKGENRMRILSNAVTGYVCWASNPEKEMDNYPFRFKDFKSIDAEVLARGKTPKHFWAMKVWDYKTKTVRVWEATQSTIQESIIGMSTSEDYGDPQGYDITISRTGEGLDTNYNVLPTPPKKVSDEVAKADKETPVNLSALYDGGNPFDEVAEKKDEITPEDIPF